MQVQFIITVYNEKNKSFNPLGAPLVTAITDCRNHAITQRNELQQQFPVSEGYRVDSFTEIITTIRVEGIGYAEIQGVNEDQY